MDISKNKAGLRYDRLRQEDVSGEVNYFAPQTLLFETAAISLAAYPSRFSQELTVEIASPVSTLGCSYSTTLGAPCGGPTAR